MTNLDPELLKNGDSRNVADEYRNWKVDSIKSDMTARAIPIHIAIENLQHDFNIGSIVRSANAFNVAGVHIVGKRHWNKRGAMSTEKYLEVYNHPDVASFVEWASAHNMSIVGVDNVEGSIGLCDAKLTHNQVLVFGQEGPGLSKELADTCDFLVAIEQFGSTRSVNVGAAAAIVMYEWVRRNHLS